MRTLRLPPLALWLLITAVLLVIWPALQLTNDSRGYAYAAQYFSEHGAFNVVMPETSARLPIDYPRGLVPMTLQPPLYPLLLAFISPRVINVVSLVVAVFFSMRIGAQIFGRGGRWVGLAAALLNVSFLLTALYQWSESPFVALATVSLWALIESGQGQRLSFVALAAVFAALAALTRYSGLVLIGAGLVWLLATGRWRAIFVYALSGVPIGIWLLHNFAFDGMLFGPRVASPWPVVVHVFQTAEIVSWWLIFCIVPALVARVFLKPRRRVNINGPAAAVLGLYGAAYIAFMVFSAATSYIDPLSSYTGRLLAPAGTAVILSGIAVFASAVIQPRASAFQLAPTGNIQGHQNPRKS